MTTEERIAEFDDLMKDAVTPELRQWLIDNKRFPNVLWTHTADMLTTYERRM